MKKQLTFLVLLAFLGAFVFSLEGCGDSPPNPCAKAKETSADFRMEEFFEGAIGVWKPYDTDTVSNLSVNFTAVDSLADSYEWRIGAGVYNTRSKALFFPNTLIGTSIPITLIVKKSKINKQCFPKDDGVDTVTRKLYFTSKCKSLVPGDYFGYTEGNPKDTVTVSIKVCLPYQDQRYAQLYMQNLDKGCGWFYDDYYYLGYRQMYRVGDDNDCLVTGATNVLIAKDNKTISAHYDLWDGTRKKKPDTILLEPE